MLKDQGLCCMLRKSVVMFMLKKGDVYDPIGSGTFFFHDGKLLIVSAAHVFEDLEGEEAAYLYAANKVFKLPYIKALVSNTSATQGSRSKDPFDIGAMVVPDEVLDECNGEINFIQRDLIETPANSERIKFYQLIGYPGPKNTQLAKKAARLNRMFIPEGFVYSTYDTSAKVFPHHRFLPEYHVALEFSKTGNFNDDNLPLQAPDPDGMSGGLIQGCFDYIPHSNGFYPTCAVAILIELERKAGSFIGVRMNAVYEWLDLHAAKL